MILWKTSHNMYIPLHH